MTHEATAPSGVRVVSSAPLHRDQCALARLLACWIYYTKKHVWS